MDKTFQKGNGGKQVEYPVDVTQLSPKNTMVNIVNGNGRGFAKPTGEEMENAQRALTIVRINVEGGKWPGYYFEEMGLTTQPPPFFFRPGLVDPDKGQILDQFCNMVQMDKAGELLMHVIDWLGENNVRMRPRFMPKHGTQFLRYHTDMVQCYGMMLSIVMRQVGEVKYNFGMQRPEEIWGRAFAAYECPDHPEFPAWHGTFAGVLMAVILYFYEIESTIVADTRPDVPDRTAQTVLEEILLIFSHCRDLAGMHFSYSSRAGYDAGVEWATKLLDDGVFDLDAVEKYL